MDNRNALREKLTSASFCPYGQRFDPEQLVDTDLNENQLAAARMRLRKPIPVQKPEPIHINLKIELPATLAPFTIEQRFSEAFDPDRVATALAKDLADIDKRRADEPVRVFQGENEIETVVLTKVGVETAHGVTLVHEQAAIDKLTRVGFTLDRVDGELAVFVRRKPVAPPSRPR